MERHYTRALLIERADAAGDAPKRYKFRASTADEARDGMVIPAAEWRLDNFLKNPVILAAHDYYSLPIGRAVDIQRDEQGLIATVEYDAGDPVAVDVMRKLDNGFMHAVSVGFNIDSIEFPTNANLPATARGVELLEISNVAVPADPNALQLHSARTVGDAGDSHHAEQLTALGERLAAVEDLLRSLRPAADAPASRSLPDLLANYPTLKEFTRA